jgi:hypothetical protein
MVDMKQQDALEHLAELGRSAALEASSQLQRSLSRQRFLARIEAEAATSSRLTWSWALPVAAAVCVAAALLLFFRTRSLTFEADGAELSGKYVSAPAAHAAKLRFSDDSTVVATPGTRLRVEETNPRGARVLLERGETSVHVVHASSTAWTFGAGPFEVRVTGTRFDLIWEPAEETCELKLHEGSVEVSGPTGSGPVVVRAGQRFRGDATRRTMEVLDLEASAGKPASTEPPTSMPPLPSSMAPLPAPESQATGSTALPNKPAPSEARAPSWSERIAKGQFGEIVSEAQARGIPSCLSACSAPDLRALSDAARYTGNTDVAERALLSMRQRFPGAQGSEAAFLLGRLHEKRGMHALSLTHYDSYLREAPSGPFAAEALAGKLRAVKATQGQNAAVPLAREYLRRFPKGVHVRTAREILGQP